MRAQAVIVTIVVVFAGVAAASEESQRFYTRGLLEFHEKQYTKALELFDKAVAVEPEDTTALYYRGVTRGLVGDTSGAITDLRAVLAKKPYLDIAALDLGVLLVQDGQYAEAVPLLTQAQRVPELDARASLFLGLAQLRLGSFGAARRNLEHAGTVDPQQRLAARYYEGVVDYREGYLLAAQERFTEVVNTDRESEVGREAALFLEKIRQAQPPRYGVYGAVGLQYDSNVALAPLNAPTLALNISHQADGRVTFNLGGTYLLWYDDHWELTANYDFYQGVQFQLSSFNIMDNGPSLQAVGKFGPLHFGLLGRYDYYLLQTTSFLQEANALPWVTLFDDRGRTELYFRFRRRDFKEQVFYVRDSIDYAPGIRQFVYLDGPARYVWAGYQFNAENAVVNVARVPDTTPASFNQYAYLGNEVEIGAGWTFPLAIHAEAEYDYRHESYNEASAVFNAGTRRLDNINQASVVVGKQLNQYLDVSAGWLGTFDDSNNPNYTYNRNIASLTVGVAF